MKCEDEKCKRIVNDIETQIKTLAMGSQVPKAPGLYLMYYNKLLTTNYKQSYTGSVNSNWCISDEHFFMIRWHYDKKEDIFEILR